MMKWIFLQNLFPQVLRHKNMLSCRSSAAPSAHVLHSWPIMLAAERYERFLISDEWTPSVGSSIYERVMREVLLQIEINWKNKLFIDFQAARGSRSMTSTFHVSVLFHASLVAADMPNEFPDT